LFTDTPGVLYAKEDVEGFTESLHGTPSVTLVSAQRSARIGQCRFGASGSYLVDSWEPFANDYFVKDFTSTSVTLTPGLAQPVQ